MKKYYPASPIVFFVDGLCVFVIVGAICAVVGTFMHLHWALIRGLVLG